MIEARDEAHAVEIANDTIGIAFGGFKQSGLGREGGVEGLRAYLEPKTMIFDAVPGGFAEAGERA